MRIQWSGFFTTENARCRVLFTWRSLGRLGFTRGTGMSLNFEPCPRVDLYCFVVLYAVRSVVYTPQSKLAGLKKNSPRARRVRSKLKSKTNFSHSEKPTRTVKNHDGITIKNVVYVRFAGTLFTRIDVCNTVQMRFGTVTGFWWRRCTRVTTCYITRCGVLLIITAVRRRDGYLKFLNDWNPKLLINVHWCKIDPIETRGMWFFVADTRANEKKSHSHTPPVWQPLLPPPIDNSQHIRTRNGEQKPLTIAERVKSRRKTITNKILIKHIHIYISTNKRTVWFMFTNRMNTIRMYSTRVIGRWNWKFTNVHHIFKT